MPANLPKDAADRMIVATAAVEGLALHNRGRPDAEGEACANDWVKGAGIALMPFSDSRSSEVKPSRPGYFSLGLTR
jgi:hypothetical protein